MFYHHQMFRRVIQVVGSKALSSSVASSRNFHSIIGKAAANNVFVTKRTLSTPSEPSSEKPKEEKQHNEVVKLDYDEYDDYEPKTAGQKVSIFLAPSKLQPQIREHHIRLLITVPYLQD